MKIAVVIPPFILYLLKGRAVLRGGAGNDKRVNKSWSSGNSIGSG